MAQASDYYFSTPVMEPADEYCEGCERPVVVVTRKDIYDSTKSLDYTYLAGSDYPQIYTLLDVPSVMAESMENFFVPQAKMNCEGLRHLLEGKGLVHNPDLDEYTAEYIRDYFG